MTLYADEETRNNCQIPGLYRPIEDAYKSISTETEETSRGQEGLARETEDSPRPSWLDNQL